MEGVKSSVIDPLLKKFTEDTFIKDSEMKYLYHNFLTEDKETLKEVFDGSNPHSWWCKFNTLKTNDLHCISGDAGGTGAGSGTIQAQVFAIIGDNS